MKKILLILITSFNWAIGIQGLDLPNTAQTLALSNTGIASPLNSSISPSYNFNENVVSFSSNYWLEGVSGKTILNRFGNHEISLNTFSANELDLWGETPDSQPLGQFGLQFYSLGYSYLFNQSSKQNLGFKVKSVYSKLYTEYIYGLLFDVGLKQNVNQYLDLGLSIKNIGYIESDLSSSDVPTEYGLGIAIHYNPLRVTLLSDYIYSDIKKEIIKVGFITNFRVINIYGSFNKFVSNKYISTGFQMRYKNISCSYGILFQDIKALGIPQSFQISIYY